MKQGRGLRGGRQGKADASILLDLCPGQATCPTERKADAIGVIPEGGGYGDLVGIAFWSGHVGGWKWDWSHPGSEPVDLGPIEATWRLTIGKAEVDGRFALRMGEFVELAEDAV